jgi:hypothetical protein
MKGNISLKSFIEEVKNELRESINADDPFFVMGDVELEVSFALDAKAKVGAKLFVLDVGGSTTATQTHKVKLTLSPFEEEPIVHEKVEIKEPNLRARIAATKAIEQSKLQKRTVQPATIVPAPIYPRGIRNKQTRRVQPVCHGGKSNRTFIAHRDNKKI